MSSVEKQYKNTKIVQTLLSSKQRGLAKQAYKGGQASSAHAVIQQHRDQRFQSRLTLRCRSLYKKRSILPTPAIAGVFVLACSRRRCSCCLRSGYFFLAWLVALPLPLFLFLFSDFLSGLSSITNPIDRLGGVGGSGGVINSRSVSKTCFNCARVLRLNVSCDIACASVLCSNASNRSDKSR